jgi:putative phosphoribosyl transferase
MERFANLRAAGLALGRALHAYAGRADVVVLTPVRGGALVAVEVAKQLRAPLDTIVLTRLAMPDGVGTAVCAFDVAGTRVDDPEIHAIGLPAVFVDDALARHAARVRACRGDTPPLPLAGKTIVLVDNAIRTGSTMRLAIRAVRRVHPARIIAAVPAGAPESRASVEAVADETLALGWPTPFANAGAWFADFALARDEEIPALMREATAAGVM